MYEILVVWTSPEIALTNSAGSALSVGILEGAACWSRARAALFRATPLGAGNCGPVVHSSCMPRTSQRTRRGCAGPFQPQW